MCIRRLKLDFLYKHIIIIYYIRPRGHLSNERRSLCGERKGHEARVVGVEIHEVHAGHRVERRHKQLQLLRVVRGVREPNCGATSFLSITNMSNYVLVIYCTRESRPGLSIRFEQKSQKFGSFNG